MRCENKLRAVWVGCRRLEHIHYPLHQKWVQTAVKFVNDQNATFFKDIKQWSSKTKEKLGA